MKRFTAFVIMMAMVMGALPAALAAEPCQSWEPKENKGLYGYRSGEEWVIPPRFTYAESFDAQGLAVAADIDGKVGVINATGAWIVEPAYDDFGYRGPDGLRWFRQDGRFGVVDASYRQLHPADIEADWMGQFANGSCVYVVGEKYGLVGVDGKRITEPVYDEIKSWYEPADGSRPVRMGELWGILTADGVLCTPIQYEDVEIWSNGYAKVQLQGKEGVLKPDGSPLTELVFDGIEWGDPASEDHYERCDALPDGDLAAVKKDGALGALSLTTGELAYPCAFASRSALVTAIHLKVTDPNKLWETADRLGREAGLQVSWYPGENIIRLYGSNRMLRVKDGKCALSGLDGTLYTGYDFDTVQEPGLDGLFSAAKNGKWGKLDKNGGTAVEFLYDTKDSIGVNARFVSRWGDDSPPYALFTLDGKPIADYIYWSHSEFYNGYAMVTDGASPWGYIDAKGTSISERKYFAMGSTPSERWHSTAFGEDGLAAVRYSEAAYAYNIIDTQGHELLEKPSTTRPWRAGFGLWGYVDSENHRMGFIDSMGKIVIEPQYEYVEQPLKGGDGWSYSFDEKGLLSVKSYRSDGDLLIQTIDVTGKVLGEGKKEQFSDPDVHEGLLWRSVSELGHNGSDGGAWGFEDEAGKLVVPHLYDAVGYFDQGYASVRAGNVGKALTDIWGGTSALTISGAVYGMLRDPRLPAAQEPPAEEPPSSAQDPLAGLDITWYPGFEAAAYAEGKGGSQRVLLYKNGHFGLYGYDGTEYAPPQFDTVGEFDASGWAPAMRNGVWGRLSDGGEFEETGKPPLTKEEAQQEADGVSIVYDIGTRTYNLKDTATGALLIQDPQPYAELWAAGCGLYGYGHKNGTFCFLNSRGEVAIPAAYCYVTDPKGIMKGNVFDENGVVGVVVKNEDGTQRGTCIDTTGKEVPPPVWTPPKRNLGTVLQGELRGYQNNNGAIEVPCVFEAALEFQEDGYALVKKDGVWGLLKDPLWDEDPDMVSDWAAAEVSAAESAGYVTLRCATYRTHPINRLQFAELAVNYLEKQTGQAIAPTSPWPFRDTVDDTSAKAHAAGIVQGVGEGRFDPYGLLTREQLATMLWRAMSKAGVTADPADLGGYTDNDKVSDWARESVATLAGLGVMEGTGGGMLSPKSACTVEQAILLVYRAAK